MLLADLPTLRTFVTTYTIFTRVCVYCIYITCSVINVSLFIQSWNYEVYDRFKQGNNPMPRLIKFFLCFWQATCCCLLLPFIIVRVEYSMPTIEMTWILDFCVVSVETRLIHTCYTKCVQFSRSALGARLCSLNIWIQVVIIYRNPGLGVLLVIISVLPISLNVCL